MSNVMRSLNIFMRFDVENMIETQSNKLLHLRVGDCQNALNAFLEIRYPAATVLLDLSANESCIEEIALILMQNNLYPIVVQELKDAF